MRIITLACAFLLLSVSVAAEPFTLGMWSTVKPAANNGAQFFDHRSWDCNTCGTAWNVQGLEFLHAPGDEAQSVGFTWSPFGGFSGLLGGTSAYINDHQFSFENGDFTLNNGHGYTSRSSQGTHTALFRNVTPNDIVYFLWFEDLPRGDFDYNDLGFQFTEARAARPPLGTPPAPAPVPEPMSLLLVGTGLLGLAARIRAKRVAREVSHGVVERP